MLIQNSFTFSDSILVYLVCILYQLHYGGLCAWLRALDTSALRLNKIKEFGLPTRFCVGYNGGARLTNVFDSVEEVLILDRLRHLNLHSLRLTWPLTRILITMYFLELLFRILLFLRSITRWQLHYLILINFNSNLILVHKCALVDASDE